MIVVKCPKCGGCFSAPGPPPPLYMKCPACHKTLRLRSRSGENLVQPGEKDAGVRLVRKVRCVWKASVAGLAVAGFMVAAFFTIRGMGGPGEGSSANAWRLVPS